MSSHRTVLELLQSRVEAHPHKHAYVYHDGEQEETLTYAALLQAAKTTANQIMQLSQTSFGGHGSVVLLLPSGVQALTAMLGAMYAGMVPVVMCPPKDLAWLDTAIPQLLSIIETSGTTIAVTTKSFHKIVARFLHDLPQVKQLKWLIVDRTTQTQSTSTSSSASLPLPISLPILAADDPCLQILTTGRRGCVFTHQQLIQCSSAMENAFQLLPSDISLCTYAMDSLHGSLIGIFTPLVAGITGHFLDCDITPWGQNWLLCLTKTQATFSGGAHRSYEKCLSVSVDSSKYNLSSWRVAYTTGEEAFPETTDLFSKRFIEVGFRSNAFRTLYSLTEMPVISVGSDVVQERKNLDLSQLARFQCAPVLHGSASRTLLSVGHPCQGVHLAIVDPSTLQRTPDGSLGEVAVRHESITFPTLSDGRSSNLISIANESTHVQWMRTGDIGVVFDGALYLTGDKLNENIPSGTLNISPSCIEDVAQSCHTGARWRRNAAVSSPNGPILFQEVQKAAVSADHILKEVCAVINHQVQAQLNIRMYAIYLLAPDTLRTWHTRKFASEAHGTNMTLDVIFESTYGGSELSVDTVRDWLVKKLATMLEVATSDIDTTVPFATFGFNSVVAVGLSGELESFLGRAVMPTIFYDYPSIDRLAQALAGVQPTQPTETVTAALPQPLTSEASDSSLIGVIGIGCRFPGAHGPDAFMNMLSSGLTAVDDIPDSRRRFYQPRGDGPALHVGGFVENAEFFDANYFGISEKEAQYMDPQQRLLLQCAWRR